MMRKIIPKHGKIKIYTSGCLKNQNKYWYRMGSAPPAKLKKDVFRFWSVNNMVVLPVLVVIIAVVLILGLSLVLCYWVLG
jgi:hypothetical protein